LEEKYIIGLSYNLKGFEDFNEKILISFRLCTINKSWTSISKRKSNILKYKFRGVEI
jgi:hypothetical protein